MLTKAQKAQMAQWERQRATRHERIGQQAKHSLAAQAARTGPATLAPAPKPEAYRDPALLDIARGRRCLLLAVEGCRGASGDTTVAAHSNLGIHGKAKGRKADDAYSAWGCFPCHTWLDTGRVPRAEKERAFMAAHLRQVLEWRRIAADPAEPERFRRAARRALEHLNATPVPETTCPSS